MSNDHVNPIIMGSISPFLRSVRDHAYADDLDAGMIPADAEADADRVMRITAETMADLESAHDAMLDRGDGR